MAFRGSGQMTKAFFCLLPFCSMAQFWLDG
jgi:hypothetical protein